MWDYQQDRISSPRPFAVDSSIILPLPGCCREVVTFVSAVVVFNMSQVQDVLQLRVRYSETDQMGTFYNSRALEWFECGRTELMRRRLGMSYACIEEKNVFLPLVEAHLEFQGGARYDDLLNIATAVELSGRAKLRFEVRITQHTTGKPVVSGHTVHAFADSDGKPIRPPAWFLELLQKACAPATT